jgi:hypothetical protein
MRHHRSIDAIYCWPLPKHTCTTQSQRSVILSIKQHLSLRIQTERYNLGGIKEYTFEVALVSLKGYLIDQTV